jgi:hypothetical protein
MFNNKFYWGTIRKSIVAFGNLFNNIHIDRLDTDGNIKQTLRVPLAYAPKQKFLARIAAQPQSFEQSFESYLPRLAFEMTSIQYDPSRRVSLVQQNRALNGSSTTTLNSQYAPTPYNLTMTLYVAAKNQDDGLQIIEQILPYFNPDYNLTLNAIPGMGIKNDLPIILDSVNYDDEYEGDFSSRRFIIWTLSFTMKLSFYGPINNQGIIRTTNVNTFSDPALTKQQTVYTATVNPDTAVPGDTISIVDSFEGF